jgi:hypothetical protein
MVGPWAGTIVPCEAGLERMYLDADSTTTGEDVIRLTSDGMLFAVIVTAL